MKRNVLLAAMMLVSGSLFAADPKDDVTSAAKKLAAADNYSWKGNVENAGGGGRFGGPSEGKADKDGTVYLTMTRGDNSMEAVMKGGKGALKGQDGWQSFSEAADDQQGPGRFISRMMQNYKAPAVEAQELAGKVKELKLADDVYSGDLTEEGAKQALVPFRFGGGDGPSVSGAKGSVKFWVKDGTLSKFQVKVQGTISFNGNDRDVDRTTTVEIKDVGTTKITIPEEAQKKLS
jgi:hypothetical protein